MESWMLMFRDPLMSAVTLSVIEAIVLNALAPRLQYVGGYGRSFALFMLVHLFLYMAYSVLIFPKYYSKLRHFPGPPDKGLIFGQGLVVLADKPKGDIMRKWMEDIPNDGVLRFRDFMGSSCLFVTQPATMKQLLVDNNYDYIKQEVIGNFLKMFLGDGLILAEGDVHKFQRKHLMSSFQVSVIRDLHPVFWAKSCELTHMLREECSKSEFEFGLWTTRATLDIIGVGIGRDFNSLKNPDDKFVKDYTDLLEPAPAKALFFGMSLFLTSEVTTQIPFWDIPRETKRISKELHDFALGLAQDRRAELTNPKLTEEESAKRNDILSLLVKSNDFSDEELASQILTFMGAGHETTANTITWAIYSLAQDPQLAEELRAEIRAHLPSPDNIATESTSAAILDSMPLLNAVCNETLRLYPVVPITIRQAIKETTLGTSCIPKGTVVLISPWAINRTTHLWGKDAMEFVPQRWIGPDGKVNNTGGASSNYDLMTFLHGPRSCIGQGFAKAELKCLVAAIVGRYDFEITREKSKYFPDGLITTKAANGMWLKFTEVPGW